MIVFYQSDKICFNYTLSVERCQGGIQFLYAINLKAINEICVWGVRGVEVWQIVVIMTPYHAEPPIVFLR